MILVGTVAVVTAGATVTVGVAVDNTVDPDNAAVIAVASDSVVAAVSRAADAVPVTGMTWYSTTALPSPTDSTSITASNASVERIPAVNSSCTSWVKSETLIPARVSSLSMTVAVKEPLLPI